MERLIQCCMATVLCLLSGARFAAAGDTAPPQRTLRAYPLSQNVHSADISPDEQLVVTEATIQHPTGDSGVKHFVEVVQVWDFKQNKILSERQLRGADVKGSARGYFADPIRNARVVRFSSDGSLVVTLVENMIYVLAAKDLAEIQRISVLKETANWRTQTLELSPDGKVAAVLSVSDMLHGRMDLFDIASGKRKLGWDAPQGWISFTKRIAWNEDGKLLVVPIPNQIACMEPTNLPDVFAFDTQTGVVRHKLITGLLVTSAAVLPGDRVLAVDGNCLGVLRNHDPKMRIFDLATGKRIRQIDGRETGVRYFVSASADGSRLLAFTGEMKARFDWGDMVPNDRIVDETFSVWDGTDYSGIVTSQNIPGLRRSQLRISPHGHYAVSVGKVSYVYKLP